MSKVTQLNTLIYKELSMIQKEVAASGTAWFKSLTPAQQKSYLKLHPGSKLGGGSSAGKAAPKITKGPHKISFPVIDPDAAQRDFTKMGIHSVSKPHIPVNSGEDNVFLHYHPQDAHKVHKWLRTQHMVDDPTMTGLDKVTKFAKKYPKK